MRAPPYLRPPLRKCSDHFDTGLPLRWISSYSTSIRACMRHMTSDEGSATKPRQEVRARHTDDLTSNTCSGWAGKDEGMRQSLACQYRWSALAPKLRASWVRAPRKQRSSAT